MQIVPPPFDLQYDVVMESYLGDRTRVTLIFAEPIQLTRNLEFLFNELFKF